ncbi:MAG: hypothetical protein ACK5KQ_01725 [Anaerorhabdus sp.]
MFNKNEKELDLLLEKLDAAEKEFKENLKKVDFDKEKNEEEK